MNGFDKLVGVGVGLATLFNGFNPQEVRAQAQPRYAEGARDAAQQVRREITPVDPTFKSPFLAGDKCPTIDQGEDKRESIISKTRFEEFVSLIKDPNIIDTMKTDGLLRLFSCGKFYLDKNNFFSITNYGSGKIGFDLTQNGVRNAELYRQNAAIQLESHQIVERPKTPKNETTPESMERYRKHFLAIVEDFNAKGIEINNKSEGYIVTELTRIKDSGLSVEEQERQVSKFAFGASVLFRQQAVLKNEAKNNSPVETESTTPEKKMESLNQATVLSKEEIDESIKTIEEILKNNPNDTALISKLSQLKEARNSDRVIVLIQKPLTADQEIAYNLFLTSQERSHEDIIKFLTKLGLKVNGQ